MKNFEKIGYELSNNQNFRIFWNGVRYLKKLEIIKKNTGGILIIDYGYIEKRMKIHYKQHIDISILTFSKKLVVPILLIIYASIYLEKLLINWVI